MKILQVVIVTIFLFYAVPSMSSDWYVIPGTGGWQGDWSRIRVDGAGNVQIWIKSVTPPELIATLRDYRNYTDYENSMILWTVNCKQETYSLKQGIDYGKGGRVISSDSNPGKHEVVAPDTKAESVFKSVCPSAN